MTEEEMMGRASTLGVMEDQQANEMFMRAAPRGRFSEQSMNQLVNAFNEVLVSMGIPEPYPPVESGMTTFPADLVRGLAMVADAAETAGVANPIDMADIADDTDVDLLAGKLMTMANNPKFVEAMAEIDEDDVLDDEDEPEMSEPMGDDDETEALLMSRA